jgi:quercetin dioxygenase-like cupin family protein
VKVVRTGDTPEIPATAPIFVGTVHSRPLIDAATNPAVSVTLVRFSEGGRNRRHIHSVDQVLYVTEGEGIVASDQQENRVTTGDIVHIPAGEIHWHGAVPGGMMAHLSILPPGQTTIIED